eukprot:CAMPEP_0113899678 /NCGR_PEP_ID=MMETSP0780_2-20120614/20191_1 /TAXON_ID=652834 /ORGANISM="Palpitomonas bilix" /LENGTH=264 /DNA_ID=CAMNT_0000891925 /DNA_START=196 /DNA_END=990 /DNA_ORIENTATION=+ /assembly_acc=CAM_ASM_000599
MQEEYYFLHLRARRAKVRRARDYLLLPNVQPTLGKRGSKPAVSYAMAIIELELFKEGYPSRKVTLGHDRLVRVFWRFLSEARQQAVTRFRERFRDCQVKRWFRAAAKRTNYIVITEWRERRERRQIRCFNLVASPLQLPLPETIVEPQEEPSSMNVEEPSSVHVEEPSSMNVEEPSSVHVEEPSLVHVEEPSSVNVEDPSSVHVEEPSSVNVEEPSLVRAEEPPVRPSQEQREGMPTSIRPPWNNDSPVVDWPYEDNEGAGSSC